MSVADYLSGRKPVKKMELGLIFTPFVMGLASGELRREILEGFAIVESIFRKKCGILYEIAEKDGKIDETAKRAFQQLQRAHPEVNPDSSSEVDAMIDGLSQSHPDIWRPAMYYFSMMEVMAISGRASYIVAAILPALRIYRHIARSVKPFVGKDHAFIDWIGNYSSEEFDRSVDELECLFENCDSKLTRKDLTVITSHYTLAYQLVRESFDGLFTLSWLPLSERHPKMVFFAGIDLVAKMACYDNDTEFCMIKGWPAEHDFATILLEATVHIKEAVLRNLTAVMPIFAVKFSYANVESAMKQFSVFEKEAHKRLVSLKLLERSKEEEVECFGREIFTFQQPVYRLLRMLKERASVISSSWCGANFYHGPVKALPNASFYSNKLLFEKGKCTGFEETILSAIDKVRIFQDKLAASGGFSMYVGDELNDILCLLKANVGITINPNGCLLKVLSQFGVRLEPLYNGILEKLKDDKSQSEENSKELVWVPDSGVLYVVSSWQELYLIIFGDKENKEETVGKEGKEIKEDAVAKEGSN